MWIGVLLSLVLSVSLIFAFGFLIVRYVTNEGLSGGLTFLNAIAVALLCCFLVFQVCDKAIIHNGSYVVLSDDGKLLKQSSSNANVVHLKPENFFNLKETVAFSLDDVSSKNGEIRDEEWRISYTLNPDKASTLREKNKDFSQEFINRAISKEAKLLLKSEIPKRTSSELDGSKIPYMKDLLFKTFEKKEKKLGIEIKSINYLK